MSSVLPELFLWDQSVNSSCGGRMECDSLFELGPPPDLILTIPPPPVPPFMEELINRLALEGINIHSNDQKDLPEEGKNCNLCQWANGNGVGFVELAQRGPLIDDTWFLVIISSCVGATLIGIILAIAFLKYREGKLKPLSDVVLAKKEKALGLERCEAVLYPAPSMPSSDNRSSRALWAGLKPLEGNYYTVDHCQPMDQKPARLDLLPNCENTYDYADYSSITYTSIGPPFDRIQHSPSHVGTLSVPLGNGRSMPASSFENIGYIPADDSAMEVERIGPDGCVVTRAAYLLGTNVSHQAKGVPHFYEMVTPKTSSKRHKSLERGSLRKIPIISAPTNVPTLRLPPLNSRYNGRYTLTALVNGSHTLSAVNIDNNSHQHHPNQRNDRKYAHVSLDRSGTTNTTLAPSSPSDNIYASPITSPVI